MSFRISSKLREFWKEKHLPTYRMCLIDKAEYQSSWWTFCVDHCFLSLGNNPTWPCKFLAAQNQMENLPFGWGDKRAIDILRTHTLLKIAFDSELLFQKKNKNQSCGSGIEKNGTLRHVFAQFICCQMLSNAHFPYGRTFPTSYSKYPSLTLNT